MKNHGTLFLFRVCLKKGDCDKIIVKFKMHILNDYFVQLVQDIFSVVFKRIRMNHR